MQHVILHVLKNVLIHVQIIVYIHALKPVEDVLIYAIHVLECVSVFVLLNVKMGVHHVRISVDGGVILHVIKNASVIVQIDVSIHVLDLVQHI